MKYIIVAKDEASGTSTNDIANPLQATEIATEFIITRLRLIDLLSTDQITIDDTVVTIEERKCLYNNIFKNVMSWKDFKLITRDVNDTVVDLLEPELFMRMAGGEVGNRLIPYIPFYRNYDRDQAYLGDIEWSKLDFDLSKPFIALVIRRRGAWPEKNMTDEFWTELIAKLKEKNVRTFIFGKETEQFASGDKIHYIATFQDWCTLVKHKNCRQVISTMTGAVYPCLMFGNSKTQLTLIDNTNLIKTYGYDPSFYNSCINFTRVDIEFIDKIPTIDEIYAKIVPNL